MQHFRQTLAYLGVFSCLFIAAGLPLRAQAFSTSAGPGSPEGGYRAYLPALFRPRDGVSDPGTPGDPAGLNPGGVKVNVPYFESKISFPQTAIFWFGMVNDQENYADVRVAYNPTELYIHVAVVDRYLWYDPKPAPADFAAWDSVSLWLDTGSHGVFRLDGQLHDWQGSAGYQAGYTLGASGWQPAALDYSIEKTWRGAGINDNPADGKDDRGWTLTYHIPYASLGGAALPVQGEAWKIGLILHDRDAGSASPNPDKIWPQGLAYDDRATWGVLSFGQPAYTAPAATPAETVTLRQGLNGVQVKDGEVGGSTDCSYYNDYWTEWGEKSQPGSKDNADFNVQNQYDIGDWPCFAKFYLTFPLDSLPKGKAILSGELVLYLFGNSGGGEWGDPPTSWIQVFTVDQDWQEATLAWNNAPLARENVAKTLVKPVTEFPGWPGVAYSFDVSAALAEAYQSGRPLRLALYSSDGEYHSGKYFSTSDAPDWNQKARPTLKIQLGNP